MISFFNKSREVCPNNPAIPDGFRAYVIGDIHGRLDLLQQISKLIETDLRRHPIDRAVEIYVGDYVDRGPDSKGVIDWFLDQSGEDNERLYLLGNHESMLLSFVDDPGVYNNWRYLGGPETLMSYGVDVRLRPSSRQVERMHSEFLARLPDEHVTFFKSLNPWLGMGDYFFVHAGVRPNVSLDKQKEYDLLWIRRDFLESSYRWEKMIVHGHTPVEEPEFYENRINIDTGAYISNCLTCLVLEGENKRILQTRRDSEIRRERRMSRRQPDRARA